MAPLFSSIVFLSLYFLRVAHPFPTDQQVLKKDFAAEGVLEVRAELKTAEIIPTVIDDFLPSLLLKVSWPSNETADLGNTIKPEDLQEAPTIELSDDTTSDHDGKQSASLTYTITLTDPDAPSRDNPEWSEMCHWIATGIAVSSSSVTSSSRMASKKLKQIMKYKPPGPPPKTGKHRYVFLVFLPANGTTEKLNLSKPDDRQHWGTGKERHGVRDWAADNGLVAVGANFIYAKNDKQ